MRVYRIRRLRQQSVWGAVVLFSMMVVFGLIPVPSHESKVAASSIGVSCVTAGSLDTSFGTGGLVASNVPTNGPYGGGHVFAGALQTDGKILTVGPTSGSSASDFFVSRHNANGTLDTTFGVQGFVLTDFFGANDSAAVEIQPDGKIVVAGTACRSLGGFRLCHCPLRYRWHARHIASGRRQNTDFFSTVSQIRLTSSMLFAS